VRQQSSQTCPCIPSYHCVLCLQFYIINTRLFFYTSHAQHTHTPPSITPHHIHTHPPHTPISCMNPAVEPMQVESSGGSSVAGGGIGAGVDVMYPTPLPILTPINVFMDADGNLLNVSELNSHTAVIGRSGEGKTHLTCHLIMQWAPIKGWNHGWVMAIMPRSVRARAHALLTSPLHNMRSHHHCTTCSLITLAQHALTSPFAQHALTSPLHNMRSRVGRRREGLPLPAVSRGDPVG
jgi:hypothetical protein